MISVIYALAERAYQASPLRDLAAHRLEFDILSQTTPFRGEVQIRGFVRNLGTLAYVSTPGQQAAYLDEQPLGGQPQLVATMPFVNLTPGEEVLVS